MPDTWTQGDAAEFARWSSRSRGATVFTLLPDVFGPGGSVLYTAHTPSPRRAPISGQVMFGHMSATALCRNFGPVYEQPPAGARDASTLHSRLTYQR